MSQETSESDLKYTVLGVELRELELAASGDLGKVLDPINSRSSDFLVSRRMFLRCIRFSTLNSSSSYLMSCGQNISKVEPLISFSEMLVTHLLSCLKDQLL